MCVCTRTCYFLVDLSARVLSSSMTSFPIIKAKGCLATSLLWWLSEKMLLHWPSTIPTSVLSLMENGLIVRLHGALLVRFYKQSWAMEKGVQNCTITCLWFIKPENNEQVVLMHRRMYKTRTWSWTTSSYGGKVTQNFHLSYAFLLLQPSPLQPSDFRKIAIAHKY